MPIVAIVLVMLLIFAAFAVDLGAAWAQRTTNQTAADAGVMAGGVAFVDDPPYANRGIVQEVERMVDASLDSTISDGGVDINGDPVLGGGRWSTCVDPEVTAGTFSPLKDETGNVINPCVSLRIGASDHGEKVLRVYLPDQPVPTSFARVIGINEISTNAFAEATLDFEVQGGALPFVIPASASAGEEYCIGDMPPGLAQSPCDGSNTGKRNDIISPWHGTNEPGTPACTGDQQDPAQLGWNIALGLDHLLRKAGAGDSLEWPATGDDDICEARDAPYIPYSLVLGGGGEELTEGFAGNGPYGTSLGAEGRLRQGSGATRYIDGGPQDPTNIYLDNVGLWEYLTDSGTGVCGRNNPAYLDDTIDGTAIPPGGADATEAIRSCLAGLKDSNHPNPDTGVFSNALLDSPRFAIVPRLWLTNDELNVVNPNKRANIKEFVPVYIQSTFWNCNSTVDDGDHDMAQCSLVFQTYEQEADELLEIVDYRQWFAPGEGDEEACLVSADQGNPKCKNNPNLALRGVTVLVLDRAWVPAEAFGGGPNEKEPVTVFLSR